VVLLPALAVACVLSAGGAIDAALVLSALACALLLVIGALYWRGALMRLRNQPAVLEFWLPRLAAAEAPSLALCLVATLAAVISIAASGWTPQNIASVLLCALALLEYVNYYKIQLQHFDNEADWRRLLKGRGFRRAHMARDIAAWRQRRA